MVTFNSHQTENQHNYVSSLCSSDGSKLYIDGVLTIDNDGVHSQKRVCKKVSLSGEHKITIGFFDAGGEGVMKFKWKLAGSSSYKIVPASAWVNEVSIMRMKQDCIVVSITQ